MDWLKDLLKIPFGWQTAATTLLSGAGDLIGGVLGRRSAEEQTAQNIAFQREFAQHGVRWRVKDAEAAGLHPLYALGANVTPFTPNPVVPDPLADSISRTGQNVSSALLRAATAEDRTMNNMRMGVLAAQAMKDQAIADYYRSEAARNNQSFLSSAPFPIMNQKDAMDPRAQGLVELKPSPQISRDVRDPSQSAANPPFWQPHQFSRNYDVILPYSEEGPGEAAQSIPWFAWPFLFRRRSDAETSREFSNKNPSFRHRFQKFIYEGK